MTKKEKEKEMKMKNKTNLFCRFAASLVHFSHDFHILFFNNNV